MDKETEQVLFSDEEIEKIWRLLTSLAEFQSNIHGMSCRKLADKFYEVFKITDIFNSK